MLSRRDKPAKRLTAQAEYRRVFCALLCLLTWRGPIPVLHCHDAQSLDDPAAAHHLDTYHVSDDTSSPGWHFHLMLWSDATGECPDDDQPRTPHEFAVVCTCGDGGVVAPREFIEDGLCLRGVDPLTAHPADAVPPGSSPSPQWSFLTSLLTTRPLCAVLGVSLC